VEVSPEALKVFIEGDFARGREVFAKMNKGEAMKADPSPTKCNFCSWRSDCKDSLYKKAPIDVGTSEIVTFGAHHGTKESTSPSAVEGMQGGVSELTL
jgi:hypothetical protein